MIKIQSEWKGSDNPDEESGDATFFTEQENLASNPHTVIPFRNFKEYSYICRLLDYEYKRGRRNALEEAIIKVRGIKE